MDAFQRGQPAPHTCQRTRTKSVVRSPVFPSPLRAWVRDSSVGRHVFPTPVSPPAPAACLCPIFRRKPSLCIVDLNESKSTSAMCTFKRPDKRVAVDRDCAKHGKYWLNSEHGQKKRARCTSAQLVHIKEQVVMIALVSQSRGLRLDTFPRRS